MQAQDTRDIGCVVLPAAPGHGVTLAHDKAIARVQGLVGSHLRRTIESPQDRATPPIQDIEEYAVIPTLRFHWPEKTVIGREMHPAAGVLRCQLQVGDETVGGMVGINREID